MLVEGLAACGYCHGAQPSPSAPLSGGREFSDSYGPVLASNITPSKSGIGNWSTEEIIRLLRASLDRDKQQVSTEVHAGYEWLSDNDTLAIVAYIKSLPPVKQDVEHRSLTFVERNTTGLLEGRREVNGYVPDLDPKHGNEYGQYLTDHVARCGYCHNSEGSLLVNVGYLTGGKLVRNSQGEKLAPDITNSNLYGIGDWSEDAIVTYLQSGRTPDGKKSDSAFCPVGFYAGSDPQDLKAIARYLKSLPAAR